MKFNVEREVLDLGLKFVVVTINNIDICNENQEFLNFKDLAYRALKKKYNNFDIETDLILRGFNQIHKKIGVKRKRHAPISEFILKRFLKGERLSSENKLMHLYNIVVLDSRLPIFIHDIDKIEGDVTLGIADDNDYYINKNNEEKNTNKGEYIYKDKQGIIQRLEIEQNINTTINKDTKNILITIEGNEDTSAEYLIDVASEVIDLITTYCGGTAQIIYK